nr:hypothetical protein [Candidatus Sigynarchaeum springense]
MIAQYLRMFYPVIRYGDKIRIFNPDRKYVIRNVVSVDLNVRAIEDSNTRHQRANIGIIHCTILNDQSGIRITHVNSSLKPAGVDNLVLDDVRALDGAIAAVRLESQIRVSIDGYGGG